MMHDSGRVKGLAADMRSTKISKDCLNRYQNEVKTGEEAKIYVWLGEVPTQPDHLPNPDT